MQDKTHFSIEAFFNQKVRVFLKDDAKKIHKEYCAKHSEELNTTVTDKYNQKDDGSTEFQLWSFLKIFGQHVQDFGDCLRLFENGKIIFEGEGKVSTIRIDAREIPL